VSTIHEALGYLFQRIETLEAATGAQEQKIKKIKAQQQAHQQDLFNMQTLKARTANGIDPALLARKLDIAIEKVEQVLREG